MMNFSPEDTLTTDDVKSFVEDAMEAEGIVPDKLWVQQWSNAFTDNYAISAGKRINGQMEKVARKLAVSFDNTPLDRLTTELATVARGLAKELEDLMTDRIEVGGISLIFCKDEGGWVRCENCRQRVALADLVQGPPMFASQAEFSHPSPNPYNIQNFLQRVEGAQTEMLKLYLLGGLRERCRCEFGKSFDNYRKV